MLISFNQTTSPHVRDNNGYGYAARLCKESLTELGHEITWRDATADVEMNFIQPDNWYWTGPYRIGYVPWESTEFLPGWIDKMNNDCDELWTPSPVIGQWMVDAGVTKTVRIYQHGVESVWEPIQRPVEGTFNVLHHGAEALRKGGNEAISSFLSVLGEEDATLYIKMIIKQWAVHDTKHIKIRGTKISLDALVALYNNCNLMLYPSWGEGFGLTPLQAMATGMPVLITRGWAPYEYLLPEEMLIDSTLVNSPWPDIHPGQMFKPDTDDLNDKLRNLYNNRNNWNKKAYDLAPVVHHDYDWLALTEAAFSHLV